MNASPYAFPRRWLWIFSAMFSLLTIARGLLRAQTEGIFWPVDLSHYLVVPAILIYFLLVRTHLLRALLGFGRREFFNETMLAILVLPTAYYVSHLIGRALLLAHPTWNPSQYSYASALPSAGALRLVATIYFAATAGFAEEIIYRGLTYLSLVEERSPPRRVVFVLLSTFLFAIAHSTKGIANVVEAFGVGICAAILMLRMRSLGPLIIAHALIDFVVYLG